jgi:very-short-patch-repair endonuclease
VADFACIALKIIVEADGGQHNESPRDATRDFVMSARGWQILRFWTSEITENLDGVIEVIRAACVARTPSPTLLRAGGRGS